MVQAILAGSPLLHAHPEIEASLERLNRQLVSTPDNAELYIARGDLYARHEEWISAEANYLRGAELAPHHPLLPRARGALELATGRPKEACRFLDTALAQNPRDAAAFLLRARAHQALHQSTKALADYDSALALITLPPPELFLQRAALLSPADALRSLESALERLGPAVALELRALEIETSLGRIEAALARVGRLAAASERKEAWLKRRGDILTIAGRPQEARQAYASALAEIAELPTWLRTSPETIAMTAELSRLAGVRS